MKARALLIALVAALVGAAAAYAAGTFNRADPFTFDPNDTRLVQSGWLGGIGCPTDGAFPDPACPTGDSRDNQNEGLLLVKTGPTANNASAGAVLRDVRGIHLTELGYDIRKSTSAANAAGSHCGAGAPRFNVVTSDGVTHFVGCNSPPAIASSNGSTGWLRLRWTAAQLLAAFPPITPADEVRSIAIVFDEGQDTAPDFFGLAVLDNIDVNGTLVGQGPPPGENCDNEQNNGNCNGDDSGNGADNGGENAA